MPRKPLKVKNRKFTISPKLRAFFETGALANGSDPDITSEDGDIFILACSDTKMKTIWEEYKDAFMADWQREKRPGSPWIENFLNDENTGKSRF